MAHQIRLDLDDESAARLATLADRAHAQQSDLAVTLLSEALADREREPAEIASALDRVPGAWERMQLGREQAGAPARRSGSTSCTGADPAGRGGR